MSLFATFLFNRYGSRFSSASEIARFQARAFRHLRSKIMPQSPFYAALSSHRLSDWPIMTKALMMEHFSQLNTRNLPRDKAMALALQAEADAAPAAHLGELAITLSPGTSGLRNLWLSDRAERGRHAAAVLGRFLPSARPWTGRLRVAIFHGPMGAPRLNFSSPFLSSQVYDPATDRSQMIASLNAQRPDLIIAAAHILVQLAQWQLAAGLRVAPRALVSTAEVLTALDERDIHEAFGIWPEQIYDSAEGLLGQTCSHGSLHLNERLFHIERDIIDPKSGAFRPIITAFHHQTLPLVRYRMEDVLIPDPAPCLCGCASLNIRRIEGRFEDVIWWKGLDGQKRLITRQMLAQTIADMPVPVLDYRIVQYGTEQIEISLDSPAFARAARLMRLNLVELANRLGCNPPNMIFRERLPAVSTGPRRRIRAVMMPQPDQEATSKAATERPSVLRIA